MKKLFTNSFALVVCGLMLFTFAIQAKPDCANVKGTGNTQAVAEGVFQGIASFGQNQTASVTTHLLGAPTVSEDGTLRAATAHTFTFADGSSFTTLDRAILSPTDTPGFYNFNTKAAITEGTGNYANACGSFNIHGTINLVTGQTVWRFTGRICDCG